MNKVGSVRGGGGNQGVKICTVSAKGGFVRVRVSAHTAVSARVSLGFLDAGGADTLTVCLLASGNSSRNTAQTVMTAVNNLGIPERPSNSISIFPKIR